MRMSQLFIQTLREAPNDARTPGYQFLVRSGLIRSLGGGFAFLPLGVLARQRLEALICRALDEAGGQQVSMPHVQPAEIVRINMQGPGGRGTRFRDRAQREMILGVSHDAAILAAASGVIQSYRQLPTLVYEAWQTFRDEERTVGGLFGAREGRVVDAYSLHSSAEELGAAYQRVREALTRALAPLGLGVAEAICAEDDDHGPAAHKVVYPLAEGEETVVRCCCCRYVADQAIARLSKAPPPPEALLPMQDVATPDCKTIAELATFLGIPQARTAKAVFLVANIEGEGDRFVFAVVRGDMALNEAKLRAVLNAQTVGPATEAEIHLAGAEPGYGSPVGLSGITVVADDLIAQSPNLVAGANRPGYHTLNVNHGRDYQASIVADIAMAQKGSSCPVCGSPLAVEQGVALAEMFQAGDSHARAVDATYLDAEGRAHPLVLGRYRVFSDRLIAAIAETHHDEHGILWPAAVAPYQVYLMTLGKATPEVTATAERLYAALNQAGIAVLYDDRDERAGVKFNDADLIGAPLRVAVGDRGVRGGTVEVKRRDRSEVQPVSLAELTSFVLGALAG